MKIQKRRVKAVSEFFGTYEYNLDSKNRLCLPAPFKEIIGDSLIIRATPGTKSHLECFFEDAFEERVQKDVESYVSQGIPERLALSMARNLSNKLNVDAHGRICIPSIILKKAEITKESVLQGMGNYFEIWNTDAYAEYNEMLAAEADKLLEAKMAETHKRYEFMSRGLMIELKNNGVD